MTTKVRGKWAVVLTTAAAVSVVVVSCGGESARNSARDNASGTAGSRAGSRSGASGTGAATSGTGGRGASAGRGGAGGTTGTRGGAAGDGGSQEGGGGSRESGGGSHASGTGGTSVENPGGAGTGGTLVNPGRVHECGNPRAWSANLELCDHDFVHRTNDASCPLPLHPEEGGAGGSPVGPGSRTDCLNDSECGTNQYCVFEVANQNEQETHCQSACATDDDCASGEVCGCNPTFVSAVNGAALTLGVCAPAGCRTDADCANGTLCVAMIRAHQLSSSCESDERLFDQFQCQSTHDECSGPDDCDFAASGQGGLGPLDRMNCAYAAGHRSCFEYHLHPDCGS